ncbi:hypothetical protein RHMOL_Rhmol06G0229100 [Rhododendron molle]|uniref:Uncharacterized protein n=1 Tax=Rhododendron molle TaxID=49168 RepID=A0ACC0NF54_RHOML|nr:hypothetical protein RHMOL_Rhmol06G0229100 [Rhododendron molle]
MDFQVPTDLIRQLQHSLRKQAGLSSYDPSDPTLPALPSLRGSVSGFDPSPPYLRCKHCQGRLLRGLQSVICVYCGKRQPKDVAPDPIKFKSTFGYQWLLQSLDLDGSETVGPSIEETGLNRGRSTPKEEISLSDLLNIEIPWPAESELTEHSLPDNELLQTKSSLNLAGVDLDNFFTESKRDLVSHSMEDPRATNSQSENAEMNAFSSQENVSLFQNLHHSLTAFSSSETKDNDGFSGWEADFQSADSGNQPEVSRSFDAFAGSAVDLSAHMDSVFGSGKDLEDEKAKHASALLESTSVDQIQDDLWNNVNVLALHQAEQVDVTINTKGLVAADNLYSHPSTGTDWLPDDMWQTSGTTAPENKTIRADDSFEIWNDFTSSKNAQDSSKDSLIQSRDQIASGEQISDITFSSSTNKSQEMDFSSLSQPDLFSGPFSNETGSVETNIMQSEVHAPERLANVKVEVGENVVQAVNNGDIFNSATQSKHDVESLLSQMHDLSFMLKSDLSVPSKMESYFNCDESLSHVKNKLSGQASIPPWGLDPCRRPLLRAVH